MDLTERLENAKAKASVRAVIEHAIETLPRDVGADLLVDILATISIDAPRVKRAPPAAPETTTETESKPRRSDVTDRILASLANGPRNVDDISEAVHGSGVTASEIKRFRSRTSNALSHMKGKGLVDSDGAGTWRLAAGTNTETNTNGATTHG